MNDRTATDVVDVRALQTPVGQRPVPADPLVSIVVPCCGQVEYTRWCLRSVLRCTRQPYELIFVDMGSLDGTAEFLDGVAFMAGPSVRVLHAGDDDGFPAACDSGVAASTGAYVVLLNNDAIVTPHWLGHLVALAQMDAKVGVVGPMSNHAPGQQSVGPVPYRIAKMRGIYATDEPQDDGPPVRLDALDRFAEEWSEKQRGQWFEAETLGAFCLLFKREVLSAIGPLKVIGSSLFMPAEDLCRKVRQAGYRLACCRDLFIHHFGSRPGGYTPAPMITPMVSTAPAERPLA